MSASPIPSGLKSLLPVPNSPWRTSPDLLKRMPPPEPNQRFKKCELLPSDPETSFVVRYFLHMKPDNCAISKIFCIHHPSHLQGFEAELVNIEEEAKKFSPRWRTEPHSEREKTVIDRWKEQTQAFAPLEVSIAGETIPLSAAQALPLWHGSSAFKCESICSSGFTYFGKHHFFDSNAAPGPASSTDLGYFGSGVYFTNSARYARLYSAGHLLLSWVSMREPYPVINDLPLPQKGSAMKMLEGKGAYQNYSAHYIPVVSVDPKNPSCMEYYPCPPDTQPAWDEFVVFQRPHTLVRFWVELSVDTPPPVIKQAYSFSACCAACQQGDLEQVKSWIQEKPERLQEKNSKGETLLFTLVKLAASEGHLFLLHFFLKEIQANPLLLQLAAEPVPKALDFLLAQGVNPETANSFKQTLLHIAAQAGQEENVKVLLRYGVQIDSRDLSKRTPLFLAVLQGHRSLVRLLIEKGARVDIPSIEGETILHAAAFYGSTPLLEDLLKHPPCKNLLFAADQDGKTPLHKAVWGVAKPDVVELLLAHGAVLEAANAYGYTALHWAAKHGHVRSAEILLEHGADPEAFNRNQDLPLDLALRYGQDEIVHLFLGTGQRLKIEGPLPKDPLKHYQDCLMQAGEAHLIEEQIVYLEKIGDYALQQKNFVLGAMVLNAALAFLKAHKNHSLFEKYFLSRIERIEGMWLETQGIKIPPADNKKFSSAHNRTDLRRQELHAMRKQAAASLQTKGFSPNLLRQLTAGFSSLLGSLILDAQALLGPPPVKWSCLGLGSMARGEMCPYSDIEFAFLIEEETPEALAYFRKLARLLQIQVINLGETSCSILGPGKESPTPNGFCMDTGGNVPLGGVFELISTPKNLAQLQTPTWIESNIILSNIVNTTCLVAGDVPLAAQYFQERSAVQQRGEETGVPPASSVPLSISLLRFGVVLSTTAVLGGMIAYKRFFSSKTPEKSGEKPSPSHREKLALKLLEGHLQEFSPNLTKEKEELRTFGIKKELYRPFQEIISSLALFYKLTSSNTLDRVGELLKLNVFCPQGAARLQNAISQALSLRLEAHLFYKDEIEFLHHLEAGTPLDPKKLYLTPERIKTLQEIYKTVIPFCKAAQQFYHTQDKEIFFRQEFYDEGPLVQGQALEKTLQYKAALAAYQQAVSLNPNDEEALLFLGKMEEGLGDPQEGLKRASQALQLALQKHGEQHPVIAICLNDKGMALHRLGKAAEALEYHTQALAIQRALYGENHPDIAISLSNMGAALKSLGKEKEALELYRQALEMKTTFYGENHSDTAAGLNNIGAVLRNLGESGEALVCYSRALEILKKCHGENHPSVARTLNNLGEIFDDVGKAKEALDCYTQSLQIWKMCYGEIHPFVAVGINNIGAALYRLGRKKEALDHHKQAFSILQALHGDKHPDVARTLNNIAVVLDNLGEREEALQFHRQALGVKRMVYGEMHPQVAISLNNIGTALYSLGRAAEALAHYKSALQILRALYAEDHPLVLTTLSNLQTALKSLIKQ